MRKKYPFTPQKKIQNNQTLIIWNFEQTLTKGLTSYFKQKNISPVSKKKHPGIVLMEKGKPDNFIPSSSYNTNEVQKYTEKFLNTSKQDINCWAQTKATLEQLLKEEYNIAIATFFLYPQAIIITFKKLGLSPESIARIPIIFGSSPVHKFAGKKFHIQLAMKYFKIEEFQRVLLIDESQKNINEAKKLGAQTVLSTMNDYLNHALTRSLFLTIKLAEDKPALLAGWTLMEVRYKDEEKDNSSSDNNDAVAQFQDIKPEDDGSKDRVLGDINDIFLPL